MSPTMFSDGGARGNPGVAGFGTVILDEQDHVLEEVYGYLGVTTNNVAEYNGLIAGLKLAIKMNITVLEVKCDSKLLVNQLNGEWKIKNQNILPLAQEAKALAKHFDSISFTWVPREKNKLADRLANIAMDTKKSSANLAEINNTKATEKVNIAATTTEATADYLLTIELNDLDGSFIKQLFKNINLEQLIEPDNLGSQKNDLLAELELIELKEKILQNLRNLKSNSTDKNLTISLDMMKTKILIGILVFFDISLVNNSIDIKREQIEIFISDNKPIKLIL